MAPRDDDEVAEKVVVERKEAVLFQRCMKTAIDNVERPCVHIFSDCESSNALQVEDMGNLSSTTPF